MESVFMRPVCLNTYISMTKLKWECEIKAKKKCNKEKADGRRETGK